MSLERFLHSPQLGEYAFHAFTADPTVGEVSEAHYARMLELEQLAPGPAPRPFRLLELGAYRHYSGHLLSERRQAEVVLSDISPQALEAGLEQALAAGVRRPATLCAADYHELPFSSGYFDAVYIASAVHHTLRPEVVLREMLRVLRPGGVLFLENEPVARELCLYLFRSNRVDTFTPYERALYDAGLLHSMSSPFIGARPELLFDMVENDRIPLDLWCAELGRGAQVELFELDHAQTSSAFDLSLLDLAGSAETACAAEIAQRLDAALEACAHAHGRVERALGIEPPTVAERWTLARRGAVILAALGSAVVGAERDARLARLFGAALRARVRKLGAPAAGPAGAAPPPEPPLFRAPMVRLGHCWIEDTPARPSAFLRLRPILPNVHDRAERKVVEATFASADWSVVEEAFGGNSLCNRNPRAWVADGLIRAPALLLVRLYLVASPERVYRLVVRQGSRVLADALVGQSESRLLQGLVFPGAGPIVFEHLDEQGRPLELRENLRIGVLQLLIESTSAGA